MASKLFSALTLASQGFHVFPIVPGQKSPPALQDWQNFATTDPLQIHRWWGHDPEYNIGISTSKYQTDLALIAVDVDNKNGGVGDESLLRLELDGWELPDTFVQITPTGGRHHIFSSGTPVRQGAHTLGKNLDIRSAGGYLVGAGSTVPAGDYTAVHHAVTPCPQWIIDRCGAPRSRDAAAGTVRDGIDPDAAADRVIFYLQTDAPLAIQGTGGDETTYKVAARCKDLGVNKADCLHLMLEHWNERCSPPWDMLELNEKILHAYKYGLDPVGVAAPETVFKPAPGVNGTPHPFDELNQSYAHVVAGGGVHILWETTDARGRYALEHLSLGAFHSKFAAHKMQIGRKDEKITELWIESKQRRSYDGIVFLPQQKAPDRFFNLWRGFAVPPKPYYTPHPAVEQFLEHARLNVCRGDETLYKWLIGYFAHLVQRPWEKPLVALVFRGPKGVGKNALVERVGALLGNHFLLTSNRRYLLGNFNGHLENCLLFTLDEAFWSGDKQAEGIVKDLITGDTHVIEHKGKEPYTVQNKTRVVIIGNDEWLVPASHDERRFAVFDVGSGRQQDRRFFESMRLGMEQDGGYSYLLRFLLDFPVSEVNGAPDTKALAEQKERSLNSFHQWWLECLDSGRVVGSELQDLPAYMHCDRFRSAYQRYVKERNIKAQSLEDRAIGRLLKLCAPSITKYRMSLQSDKSQPYAYHFQSLAVHRTEWEQFIGHRVIWPDVATS